MRVGQYLTFTIEISNTGGVVVTDLPVIDNYETDILQPALDRTSPRPDTTSTGELRWSDLTSTFGDLDPGERFFITAVFRAIRIDDEVINRVRTEAGIGSGGGGGGNVGDAADGKVEGGRVIVEKQLIESFVRLDTPVISFTLTLRNDGFADIVRLPLADTYRREVLSFVGASIPPDFHNPATGELRWNDLLASLGRTRLAPQETISFTTRYTVTGDIEDAVVNSADSVGAADEFGNRVESPRRAEVRIRIRGGGIAETVSPTPSATPGRRQERTPAPSETETSTAETATITDQTATAESTVTSESTVTTEITATSASATAISGTPTPSTPRTLPRTGGTQSMLWPLLVALGIVALGVALRVSAQQRRRP